ncbi:MAG: hypothetical protein F8N37_03950 [Telmatospirillum sp.]|nr:hypothetical protein [Telmatospirillum sp.]
MPVDGELPHLTVEERSLFDDLKADRLGDRVRLEQERIPFGLVLRASAKTSCGTSSGGLIGLR